MTPTEMNASEYDFGIFFYNAEFESILSKIIACYYLMITDNVLLANDENAIRDVLLINYLKDNSTRNRIELTDYLFDREVLEDRSSGRTDIKIQTLNTFRDTSAYYIIECKRLDKTNPNGKTGLNAEYVKNGICRFVTGYYSSHFNVNGMVGFIVEGLDIDGNIMHINLLLDKDLINDKGEQVNAMPVNEIRPVKISNNFKYSYTSTHQTALQKKIILYHLMFDFSNNIQ